jgi:hypothetical protein
MYLPILGVSAFRLQTPQPHPNKQTKAMKTRLTNIWRLLPCVLITPLGLYAQATTEELDDENVVELSPFEVTGDTDIGYQATSTLAGTRLRTELRDIGSSISIVNEEFLTDTGSANLEDVLIFTPNTEVGGIGGNFSGSQGASPIPEQQRDNPSGGVTRVRGLAGADLTRDYFLTDVPFDTFNTDRIDVQRGANSALFGLGSPGGIVNATTIRADFLGNRGRVRFETDQYGTTRYSMRYNQMIGDVAAIRIAGLSEDKGYEQKQAFLEDNRLFASATVKLPFGLTARASYETAERSSANPDYVPPNDGITPWINLGKPIIDDPALGGSIFRDTGLFFPGRANNQVMTLALPGLSSGHASFYQDPSNPEPTFGGAAYIRAGEGLPNPYPVGTGEWMMLMPFPEEQIIRRTAGFRSDGTRVAEGTAGFYSNGFVAQQITDRSIFDYRKNLFNGGTAQQGADWEVYNASIEGNYFDNRLGFEVAYYEQDFTSRGNNSLQGITQRTIYIDPNAYLLATTNGDGDGPLIPNPNFGRPVMGGSSGGNLITNNRDAFRIQAYGELRFDDFMNEDSWVTTLLGRLTLTGLVDESSTFNQQAYGRGDRIDQGTVARAIGGGSITGYVWPAERSGQQFALPVSNDTNFLAINSINDLAGVGIQGVSHGRARSNLQGNLFRTYTGWDQHNATFTTFDSEVRTIWDGLNSYPAAFSVSKRLTEVESQVLVGQSYLWDDTIVLTGSWRSDTSSTAGVGAATVVGRPDVDNSIEPGFVRGPQSSDLVQTYDDETTSWGAVVHTPDFIAEKLPNGLNLSFHYSESQNFVPSGSNVNIYNELVPALSGETEEMGFTIGALDGKLQARFNWFDTSSANNRFENAAITASTGILQNLAFQLDNPLNIAQGFTAADAQAVLPPQGVIDVSGFIVDWNNPNGASTNRNPSDTGTRDFTAEGMEIEIAYNPTPEWTILISVGQQETVTSNTYPVMLDYMNTFVIPQWVNSSFAQNFFINDQGSQTLAQLAQEAIVDNVVRGALQDGNPSIEQSEWRWNLNTSYNFGTFESGILKYVGDLTVGGGVRWQDKVGIGFAVARNDLGDFAQDVNQPFFGDSNMFVDVFARSRWALRDNRAFTLQLNVKDLMNTDGLQAYVANPDGSELYRIFEGRLISASATLEF